MGARAPLPAVDFIEPLEPRLLLASTPLTDAEKQQQIRAMVDSYRGPLPPELVLSVMNQEGGNGALHVDGWRYNSFYLQADAPWAQPTNNGDGVMQVTTGSGARTSGAYTADAAGYDHSIHDGCNYLRSQYTSFGTFWQSALHYNTGPRSLYIYLGLNAGDRQYLAHVETKLRTTVPAAFGLSNATLADNLHAAQQVVDGYLTNPAIAAGQPASYYTSFQTQLDNDLRSIPGLIPRVQSVAVNDGHAQRSMVKQLAVTFDQPGVTVATGAFVLRRRDGGAAPAVAAAPSPTAGPSVFLLTFSGSGVAAGSLADGVYDLTVVAAKVRAGAAAPNVTMPADHAFEFHRLFGDADGDGDTDNADLFFLRPTYARPSTDAAFKWYFDADGDGDVDNADLVQVRGRRGVVFKGY